MDLEAILFDFDGTLVRLVIDFEAMRRRVREVALAHGVDLARYGRLYILEFIEQVGADLGKGDPARAARFRRQAAEAVLAEEIVAGREAEVFPGVPELLQKLCDEGFKVGIVTRNCRRAVEEILARTALAYHVLLTRDDVRRVKPDPEHLLAALRALGASPGRALMVGDHPMDVQAGQAIGARTVGILNDGQPADYFAAVKPDRVLRSVVELPVFLEEAGSGAF